MKPSGSIFPSHSMYLSPLFSSRTSIRGAGKGVINLSMQVPKYRMSNSGTGGNSRRHLSSSLSSSWRHYGKAQSWRNTEKMGISSLPSSPSSCHFSEISHNNRHSIITIASTTTSIGRHYGSSNNKTPPSHLYQQNKSFQSDSRQLHILQNYLDVLYQYAIGDTSTVSFRGVYLYGGVGCGKTMMMDLLHQALNGSARGRLPISHRTHFSRFMMKFHQRMHLTREENPSLRDNDAIFSMVLDSMIDPSTKLLCFDEFQVTDIADAMILKRLFEGFFKKDILVVTTSNRAPSELYQNGINRDNFVPFIHLLEERLKVVALKDAPDYRLAGLLKDHMYICSDNREEDVEKLKHLFEEMTKGHTPEPDFLLTHGRMVKVPLAANGVAYCTFDDLCRASMSSVDYIAICENYHTLIMQDVPQLDTSELDAVRRFISLIDEVYQHKVQFICSAHATPKELLNVSQEEKENSQIDELFAFDRTVSRLIEMQSEEYSMQIKKK